MESGIKEMFKDFMEGLPTGHENAADGLQAVPEIRTDGEDPTEEVSGPGNEPDEEFVAYPEVGVEEFREKMEKANREYGPLKEADAFGNVYGEGKKKRHGLFDKFKKKEAGKMRLGSIEAGGTKMICAVVSEDGEILKRMSVPTKRPEETLPLMHAFFEENEVDCLGIACFGPIDLDKNSPTYGYITTTPKEGWANTDMVGAFSDLGVPVGFDTDVNGSVTGEAAFGIAKGIKNVVYFTIGTGVGAGILCEGNLVHGMMHPEGGHVLLTKREDDPMAGSNCPFHPNCFEGLCAGPAIMKRWGKPGAELADREEVWDLEAYYIAQALVDFTMILSPEMFILGGGVSHQTQILPLVRKYYAQMMNGYIKTKRLEDLDSYIVCQSLNDEQGILGAAIIGRKAYDASVMRSL